MKEPDYNLKLVAKLANYTESNITDYFNKNGEFLGFDKISTMQLKRIKTFKREITKDGESITIELFDTVPAIVALLSMK